MGTNAKAPGQKGADRDYLLENHGKAHGKKNGDRGLGLNLLINSEEETYFQFEEYKLSPLRWYKILASSSNAASSRLCSVA